MDNTLLENLLNFFRVFTFWTMKARSAVVGAQGVYPFLKQVKQTRAQHPLRIHLLGHSFGAKLLTSAVYSASQEALGNPFVDTLVLLLGAFSKFAFSTRTPAVQQGLPAGYAAVVTEHLVANPLVAIYSQYDLANLLFYPLGMLPVFTELLTQGEVPTGDLEHAGHHLLSQCRWRQCDQSGKLSRRSTQRFRSRRNFPSRACYVVTPAIGGIALRAPEDATADDPLSLSLCPSSPPERLSHHSVHDERLPEMLFDVVC
jgi:hypothetical protein